MTPTVKQNPANEQAPEILADAIVQVADAAKRLLSSRLSKRAILVLLHDSSGVGKRDIELVLNHAAFLAQTYLKQPAAKK